MGSPSKASCHCTLFFSLHTYILNNIVTVTVCKALSSLQHCICCSVCVGKHEHIVRALNRSFNMFMKHSATFNTRSNLGQITVCTEFIYLSVIDRSWVVQCKQKRFPNSQTQTISPLLRMKQMVRLMNGSLLIIDPGAQTE